MSYPTMIVLGELELRVGEIEQAANKIQDGDTTEAERRIQLATILAECRGIRGQIRDAR